MCHRPVHSCLHVAITLTQTCCRIQHGAYTEASVTAKGSFCQAVAQGDLYASATESVGHDDADVLLPLSLMVCVAVALAA